MNKIGVSVNIGNRNQAMTYGQTSALNALMVANATKYLWIVPAGAQFAAKWNDPVNLAEAGLLGIDPTTLVGHP